MPIGVPEPLSQAEMPQIARTAIVAISAPDANVLLVIVSSLCRFRPPHLDQSLRFAMNFSMSYLTRPSSFESESFLFETAKSLRRKTRKIYG
jgi:hypothetical protein